MKEKIIEALNKLDVENDNHWTQDGLPKLDALKFAVGGNVTREDVTTVAPDFTRTNPVIGEVQNGANAASAESLGVLSGETKSDASSESVGESSSDTETQTTSTDSVVLTDSVIPSTSIYTANIKVELEEIVKSFFSEFDVQEVSDLSDDELEHLAKAHSEILSADNAFQSEVAKFARQRAMYLNAVAEEYLKRKPASTLTENLSAFRDQVMGMNNLPINTPRQVVRTGPKLLGR